MSSKLQEYLHHAQEAERLAQAASGQEERSAYERIAAVWRELAEAENGQMEVRAEQAGEATPQRATAKSQ